MWTTVISGDINVCLNQRVDTELYWERDWLSEVYIQAKTSSVTQTTEYFVYDSSDLIGDIGGYLGLFLGWSLLSIFSSVLQLSAVLAAVKEKLQTFLPASKRDSISSGWMT